MERVLIVYLTAFFIAFMVYTNTCPVKEPDILAYPLPQGCMIYTLAYRSALNARGVLDDRCYWSCVAALKFKDAKIFHAVLIYDYLGDTWIYDCNRGSYKVFNRPVWDLKLEKILQEAYPEAEIEECMWIESTVDHHDNYGYPQ